MVSTITIPHQLIHTLTETDFMAPRAPLPNKLIYLLTLLAVALAFVKCGRGPTLTVSVGNAQLNQHEGVLYYQGTPFTGITQRFYTDGKLERQTIYHNGKEDGVMQGWYPNGARAQERLFVNGSKEGIHKGWWPDGKPKFEYQFNDDEYDGTAKEWFADGKPFRLFHYTKGHENGLEQMWWADGTIRANYVVKDGRQYGLIGRKLCRNITNEKVQ